MNNKHHFLQAGLGASLAFLACFGHPAAVQAQAPAGTVSASAPHIDSVQPPNWWANNKIDPVRLLMRGQNLAGARVQTLGSGISASNEHVSASGHYIFVDVTIKRNATPGTRLLRIVTPQGVTTAPFRVSVPLSPKGRFQGFSRNDVIYLIMVDRFSDGNVKNDNPPSAPGIYGRNNPHLYHGGDFQGIINHLPYLKKLGITAIWMTPIYENVNHNTAAPGQPRSADYHGYGAVNEYKIDPHFGTMATLRELVSKAHALGIKVIQDQVANHVGPFNPWATNPPTPTWFNGTVKHHLVNTFQIWTVMDPHATPPESAATLDGWFVNTLPDLNQNDPEVARYEIQNTLWWLGETGFDGIREDTLPYVPRSFWHRWSAAIKRQYPHVNTVGEVFNGDAAQVAYFQGGRKGTDGIDTGIGSLFDYPLYYPLRDAFAGGKSLEGIAQDEAHDWLFPDPDHLVTFFGDHDVQRFMNRAGATPAGLMLADTFLLTNRGIPLMYYGDEIGMPGGNDPDNRHDFPGGFPGDPSDAFTAAGRTPQQQAIWQHVSLLTHLRAALAPLRVGEQKTLYITDGQWAYARILGQETVIVAFNNATAPATFTIPVTYAPGLPNGSLLTDRLGIVSPVRVTGGSITITLPARQAAILTK